MLYTNNLLKNKIYKLVIIKLYKKKKLTSKNGMAFWEWFCLFNTICTLYILLYNNIAYTTDEYNRYHAIVARENTSLFASPKAKRL